MSHSPMTEEKIPRNSIPDQNPNPNPKSMKLKSLIASAMLVPCVSYGAAGTFDELIWTTTSTPFSYGSSTFFEIDDNASNLFGAAEFHGANLGTFNLGEMLFITGEQKSFKNNGTDVTGHTLYWQIGSNSGTLGYGFEENIGGGGDQRWGADGYGGLTSNVLAGLAPGSYTLSVWSGISTNGVDAATTIFNNRSGANYNATLTIIPEPASAALGLIGSLLLLRRRRF